MDAKTKINGHYYTKKQMTDLLLSIFVRCIAINNYAFRGKSIRDVITSLLDFVDVDSLCIDERSLKSAIATFCDYHDTGIYY